MSIKGFFKKIMVRNRKPMNDKDNLLIDSPIGNISIYEEFCNYNPIAGKNSICILKITYEDTDKFRQSLSELYNLIYNNYDSQIVYVYKSENSNELYLLSTFKGYSSLIYYSLKNEKENILIQLIFEFLHRYPKSLFKDIIDNGCAKNEIFNSDDEWKYSYVRDDRKTDDIIVSDKCINKNNKIYPSLIDISIPRVLFGYDKVFDFLVSCNIQFMSIYFSNYNGKYFIHIIFNMNSIFYELKNKPDSTNEYFKIYDSIFRALLSDPEISKLFIDYNNGEDQNYLYENIDELVD